MARPTKTGLDYFPLDTELDTKIKLVDAKYGNIGFALVIKLWMLIYKEDGYFTRWNEEKQLLFRASVREWDEEEFYNFIKDCFKWEIFDENMYMDYNILTSRGIQKRYFHTSKRRKNLEINSKYVIGNFPELDIINGYSDINDSLCEHKPRQSGDKCEHLKTKGKGESKGERKEKGKGESINAETPAPPPGRYPDSLEDVFSFSRDHNIPDKLSKKFFHHYQSTGWKIKNHLMKDWRSRLLAWYEEDQDQQSSSSKKSNPDGRRILEQSQRIFAGNNG